MCNTMAQDKQPATRRRVLKTSGAAFTVGMAGLAGCAGDGGDGSTGNDNQDGTDSDSNSDSDNSGGGSGEEIEITFAHPQPPENVSVQATQEHFIDVLEEETDGRITVDLQAATLGGTEDNLDAIEAGTVDMGHFSPTGLSTRFSSEYSFAGDPFVVRDMDHYKSIQEEFLLPDDGLNGILAEEGLQLGDSYYVGNRGFTANSAVETPEDAQGMKLRLPQYDTWISVWEEIGAEPTPVPYDELYSALQTGVADASEGPISQFMAKSLYEVQSHFAVTNHLLDTKHFMYNQEFLDSLSSEDRDLIMQTASDATSEITQTIKDEEQSVYDNARDEGTTIVEADSIDREAFVDAGMPALEQLSEESWAVDIEDIRAL